MAAESGAAQETVQQAYAPMVRLAQGLTFISGMVALNEEGQVISPGDMYLQAVYVLGRLRSLLNEVGGSLESVIKINAYLANMDRYPEFSRARAEYFAGLIKPASTAVGVASLFQPGLVVEIEAVADLSGSRL